MGLYDEKEVLEKIKELPRDVKLHLNHVVRNGFCKIIAASLLKGDVEEAVMDLEKQWVDLGL